MNAEKLYLFLFLTMGLSAHCQKLYVSPNLGLQSASLNYYPGKDEPENNFISPRPTLVPFFGATFQYKTQSITHRLAVASVALGINFKVIVEKPYALYAGEFGHSSSIDYYLLNYSLQQETKAFRKFIGKTTLKYKWIAGVGIGTNRSEDFYRESYNGKSLYTEYQTGDFFGYDYKVYRKNIGIFLTPEIGFDVFNRKGKSFLNIELFYYKGMNNMITYDIHYYYGNIPNSTRHDAYQIARSRGTVFGLKVGVPISLTPGNRKTP